MPRTNVNRPSDEIDPDSNSPAMPLSGRHDDPMLEQIARDTFALFPHCHVCGRRIDQFEHADVRVHVQRVVHRGGCPVPATVERVLPPERGED